MSYFAVGIDIGGTKIRSVLVKGCRILRGREAPTPKTKKQFIKLVGALISMAPNKGNLKIGIGVAGVLRKSAIVFCPNIRYLRNFDFKTIMPRDASLLVDNDARCFARGECDFGAGKKFRSIFALTVGTGIGRAYAEKGVVKKIKKFEYPEYWEKEYQRVRDRKNDGLLATYLGEKLWNLINRLHPSAIIIGGGVMARKKVLSCLRQKLKNRGIRVPVLRPRFRKNSAAIGAALCQDVAE